MPPPLKTHCKRGHAFTPENVIYSKLATGYVVRKCRRCRAQWDAARYMSNPKHQAAIRHKALSVYLKKRKANVVRLD